MQQGRTNRFTVIVAGGSGKRMESDLPKQFIKLANQPVLLHTLYVFHEFDREGLEAIDNNDGLVAIHDAVRPLVNVDTISRCFDSARKYGNALPAISPNESVRITVAGGNKPLDRKNIYLVQTPQVFSLALIKKAYMQEYKPDFTDDATVFEASGEKITLADIEYAEVVLKQRKRRKVES
jgi:2-C-methyl-D-erythritol 4-phosphate cytidylyltransferase